MYTQFDSLKKLNILASDSRVVFVSKLGGSDKSQLISTSSQNDILCLHTISETDTSFSNLVFADFHDCKPEVSFALTFF